MLEEAEDKVRKYVEISGDAEELMTVTEAGTLGEETEGHRKVHYKKLRELRSLLSKNRPAPVEEKPVIEQGQTVTTARAEARKQPVKIKAMDCPTWDGKYRSFPRFKAMWDENIGPRHEESALHFMLCQSLPKSVLENISTFSSSADDIWSYLDEKYGKSEVVAKEVMTELMALDPKKLGQRFMGRFCTMVLDSYKLLAEMGETG